MSAARTLEPVPDMPTILNRMLAEYLARNTQPSSPKEAR